MEERRREIRNATKALLGSKVAIVDAVEPIAIAGQPGAGLRSTAKDAKHFVHHSIATAPMREGARFEIRWSVVADYAPGTRPDRAATKVFDHIVANIVQAPHSPAASRGWVAQSCGANALVVPASFSRPTSFEFEGPHGEKLAVAVGGTGVRWWGYFDETLDRLQVRDDVLRTIDSVEERVLVIERHRDEQRLTDTVLSPELNDVHAVREANITHDGTSLAIFAGTPISSRLSIEHWWRAVMHSLWIASSNGTP
jgi:hypothetical protein